MLSQSLQIDDDDAGKDGSNGNGDGGPRERKSKTYEKANIKSMFERKQKREITFKVTCVVCLNR